MGQSALDRSLNLKDWWCSVLDERLEFLKPNDWFNGGHDHSGINKGTSGFWRLKTQKGIFVWSPPAVAADVAIEELRKVRLKRQHSLQIVLIHICLHLSGWNSWKNVVICFSSSLRNFNFGMLTTCVSHFVLAFVSLFVALVHSNCRGRQHFSQLVGNCGNCLNRLTRNLSILSPSLMWKLLHFRPDREISSSFPVCRQQSKRIRKS